MKKRRDIFSFQFYIEFRARLYWLVFSIFIHPFFYILIPFTVWLLGAMIMTRIFYGKSYLHKKSKQIITIEKSGRLLCGGTFPQIWNGMQVGEIYNIYFRPFLKSLPSKKYGGTRK